MRSDRWSDKRWSPRHGRSARCLVAVSNGAVPRGGDTLYRVNVFLVALEAAIARITVAIRGPHTCNCSGGQNHWKGLYY